MLKKGKFDDNHFMHLIYIDEYMKIVSRSKSDEQKMSKILQKLRDFTY